LIVYTDSDFAVDKTDRKSTSGRIILSGKSLICWISKKQSYNVSTSTAETEYISTSEHVKKILWLKKY